MQASPSTDVSSADLYLDLLKKCLTRTIVTEGFHAVEQPSRGTLRYYLYRLAYHALGRQQLVLMAPGAPDPALRAVGHDLPADAETMVGLARLDNIHECARDVLRRGVPGDFLEAGVWRGGASIFARGILQAYGDRSRTVWVADSFHGLPQPNAAQYPADRGDKHWTRPELAVSLDQVRANFARYGLLDEQVRFLPGWFKDTLANAPIERLALLRVDGDMYESTIQVLDALYPKVAIGGYVILDDHFALDTARKATDDYRAAHGITEPIQQVDWAAGYWRRER